MKAKTRKAVVKRFRITKKGKLMARSANQDHFNSRESGNVTRRKRLDKKITSGIRKTIIRQIACN